MEVSKTTKTECVSKTTIENNQETVSMLNEDEKVNFFENQVSSPIDRYNLVYIIVLLHGIGEFLH